ncbi:hypothetical protein NM208_g5546 [Fusarium decemcellulare]|uniref:Uncharacterized protein n=1 Tax=Fusarium decemcellulare TaxID=57161 RepID=A0ACC1SGW3_9HYPO|nr:hypothetical protein NM208_g5546 [Fusarium decemcellulare]
MSYNQPPPRPVTTTPRRMDISPRVDIRAMLLDPRSSRCSTSRRHPHLKKRRATAVYIPVSPRCAAAGSAARRASAVLSASTAVVN